ncbi:MFS transporter [Melghirimyces algeriensis]|uniref:Multidrug resistance protein n=1 Tax=Melghirimyces algeriensis TaxID=910412 RepID=A0A521FG78_9BACL|nr:MFS transporter [Melghirimyces algeriensis]SMO95149.1 Multidrug resistance protein [Melghirimyces algeriensis]
MNQKVKSSVLVVVILAIFADMLMYGLVVPFLPVHAESLGASQSEIGLLFASYALALFVATPFFGALADKVGRKKLLVFGLIALAVTTLIYAFATSFWVLFLARLLQGFAAAIPWTAGLALLAEVFPKEERGKAMGMAMSGQAVGVLLGPPIGGWLYELGGYHFPFFTATGIALIIAILCLVSLRKVSETKSEGFTSPFKILRNRNVLIIAGVSAVGASVFASIEPTLPIHFNENLEISAGVIGLLFVLVTLGYGLTSPLIGSISTKFGHVKTIRIGIVMAAIVLPLNALPTLIWLQVVTLTLLGITLGMVLTPALPKLADISQEAGATSQGLTYAVYNTAYSFGMMAGPVVAGTLTDGLGLIIAYSVMGGLFILYLFPLAKLKS